MNEKCLNKLYKYLSRSRTKIECFHYLEKHEFDIKDINECINYLEELKYIDDEDYTKSFIQDKINFNNWGLNKIVSELKKKGIDNFTIDDCLEDYYETSDNKLKELIIKRISSKKLDIYNYNDKSKLKTFLFGKGYSISNIDEAIREFIDNYEE